VMSLLLKYLEPKAISICSHAFWPRPKSPHFS